MVAHGFYQDGIAIVVIGNHQVLVALAGGGWELASEVNVQALFQFDVNNSCIQEMSLFRFLRGIVIIRGGLVGGFGGLYVLAPSVLVSFGCDDAFR